VHFLGDVWDEEDFYATQRTERRADQRRHRAFAEEEIDNPNSMLDNEDPRWMIFGPGPPPTMSRLY
jgi:hypothetical protein